VPARVRRSFVSIARGAPVRIALGDYCWPMGYAAVGIAVRSREPGTHRPKSQPRVHLRFPVYIIGPSFHTRPYIPIHATHT
jgi:hypothetical protein